MSLRDDEFRVLRETIATRGTVRMVLVPAALSGWALLAGAALLFDDEAMLLPTFSLIVLIAAFEAVHALHVGVERVGRYLQVFYESGAGGPQWESTAMRLGPGLPGSGVDPLFTLVFCAATLANLAVVFAGRPPRLAAAVSIGLHATFVIRMVRARLAAGRQRARDLEIFQRLNTPDAARLPAPRV